MKSKVLLTSIMFVLLMNIVSASVTIYPVQDRVVYSEKKLFEWRFPYKDVRQEQLRGFLNRDKHELGYSKELISSASTKMVNFQYCGSNKLYGVINYEDCVVKGMSYCDNSCNKFLYSKCEMCKIKTLNLCYKSVKPMCNLLFSKKVPQQGKYYYFLGER